MRPSLDLRAALILVALVLALAASCKVEGVVGEHPLCEPACSADRICDPELATCVECLGDGDCHSPDAGACVAGACVACTSSSDCPDELRCAEGRCVDPDDDDQEEDDDEEEEEEEESESDNSGEG